MKNFIHLDDSKFYKTFEHGDTSGKLIKLPFEQFNPPLAMWMDLEMKLQRNIDALLEAFSGKHKIKFRCNYLSVSFHLTSHSLFFFFVF